MNKQQRMMPHYAEGRFWNYSGETIKSVIIPSCLIYLNKLLASRPHDRTHLSNWQQFNDHITLDSTPIQSPETSITWIGHASFLVKIGEYTILTDPVFNNLTFLFPRLQGPGIRLEDIPHIDVVLISHNHRDHLEKTTITYLAKKYNPLFLVPRGDKKTLAQWGISRVSDLMWWDNVSYNLPHAHTPLSLTFLPTFHWSGRTLFDTNHSLWGSWMISYGANNYYFAGDTANGKHFQEIAREFPSIHTALMPIGPCEPNSHLKISHITAEEAGEAFLTLNAQNFIPMHWGTFGFGIDRPLDPLHRLEAWWQKSVSQLLAGRTLIPLRIGQQVSTSATRAVQQVRNQKEIVL